MSNGTNGGNVTAALCELSKYRNDAICTFSYLKLFLVILILQLQFFFVAIVHLLIIKIIIALVGDIVLALLNTLNNFFVAFTSLIKTIFIVI